ncbi:MAG: pyridoxamine 5'-phosphate oxidase [bacterium]|nr:pyridoxamine 5'-phosphate oxidase [bacterium]
MSESGTTRALRKADVDPDPIVEFGRWFERARSSGLIEPTAVALSTADAEGRPSGRMVLLKGVDRRGFVFYTNFRSRKGAELEANPWASLNLWWDRLQQQVQIEGSVTKIEQSESDVYFAGRPRGSQLGAWASEQSRTLPGREALEESLGEVERRFAGERVTRPPNWGGFLIEPQVIEFWQGQPDRLHDRIRYRRDGGGWVIERLAP